MDLEERSRRCSVRPVDRLGVGGVIGVAVWLGLVGCAPTSMPRSVGHPLAGEAAPRFEKTAAMSSREVSVPGTGRTRVTVVDFFASWCGPCQETIPVLDELWRDHRRDGLMVIGVSIDESTEEAVSAAERMGASFPIVVDQRLAYRYAVAKIPITFVIDEAGTVRWVGRRPDEIRQAVEFMLSQ